MKRSDNPDVIYGRDFEEEAMKIEELIGEMGEVVIRGKVLSVDTRDIKNEKTIIIFNISDFTDTMTIKMFVRTEQVKEVTGDIKPGAFLKVKGICMMDKFDHELAIGSTRESRRSLILPIREWIPPPESVWSCTVIQR